MPRTKASDTSVLNPPKKHRGRPKGSKNTPTLFETRRHKADFLSIPGDDLRFITNLSNETRIGKQQVLEDMLKTGRVAVRKMYLGLIETRKAIMAELSDDDKSSLESVVRPARASEPVPNGSVEGDNTGDARTRVPVRRVEGTERLASPASLGGGFEETPDPDFGETELTQSQPITPDAEPAAEEEPEPVTEPQAQPAPSVDSIRQGAF